MEAATIQLENLMANLLMTEPTQVNTFTRLIVYLEK